MSDNTTSEQMAAALSELQKAFKTLTLDEVKVVKELQAEVDTAFKAGTVADPKLEFCYSVKFSTDRLNNAQLLRACNAYIEATEGK